MSTAVAAQASIGEMGSKDYKVEDINIAEWGIKEIKLAEQKCQALWQLEKNTKQVSHSRANIIGCIHDHTNCCVNRNFDRFRSKCTLVILQHIFNSRSAAAIATRNSCLRLERRNRR